MTQDTPDPAMSIQAAIDALTNSVPTNPSQEARERHNAALRGLLSARASLAPSPAAPVAWLRDQRGIYEGRATLEPLFLLGEMPPEPRNGATYSPLYEAPAAPSPAGGEAVAWRYQDARGHFRYRGYVAGFDVEYHTLKPVPLYLAAPAAPAEPDPQPEPATSRAITLALNRPECDRLREWASIGPVQRAEVQSFADAIAALAADAERDRRRALAVDFREYLYRVSSQVPFEHAQWAHERGEALLAALRA